MWPGLHSFLGAIRGLSLLVFLSSLSSFPLATPVFPRLLRFSPNSVFALATPVFPRLLRFSPGYSVFPPGTPVFPSCQTVTLHDLGLFVVPLTKKMPKPWDLNISCYYSVLKLKGVVEDIREKKKKDGRGRD